MIIKQFRQSIFKRIRQQLLEKTQKEKEAKAKRKAKNSSSTSGNVSAEKKTETTKIDEILANN